MDDLQRLVAIEDIRQLKARYFRLMDTKDWEGLAKVFAPDAQFDLRQVASVRDPLTGVWEPPYGDDSQVFRSKPVVLKMIHDALQHRISAHHGHMAEIEISSDRTAHAVWAMEDVIRSPPGEPHIWMQGYGHYHDTYVRLTDGWAIQTTRITRLYMAPEPT